MSRWPVVKLGDVVEINPRNQNASLVPSMPITFVPMAAVSEDTGRIEAPEIRAYSEVSKGYTSFRNNDVLFAKITPCMENGKAAIAHDMPNGIGAGSTEFFVLRSCGEVLPHLIWHYVRRPSFRALCKANFTGSAGQQRVPRGFLEKVLFPLPPLEEQRRIVALLDRAAEIRRRADAARAKARAIIPALFLDMFGDPATNPKGWPIKALADVASIGSGLTKGRKLTGSATTMVPYLRVANVQDGHLDLSEIKLIEATEADILKNTLRPGDLLMTEGGDPDKLGRCAIWNAEIGTCVHQNHIFRVRVSETLLPAFAARYVQSDAGKAYFLKVAKRTTGIASVNKTQLGALPVWVPPLPLQTAFAEQAARIEAVAAALDGAALKADAMAAALSAEIFG